jgi:hypothetical protein
MPRSRHASSRNRRSQPRAAARAKAEHEQPPSIGTGAAIEHSDTPAGVGTTSYSTDNLPEYLRILHEAVFRFGIDVKADVYPSKAELVDYFKKLRLSNGMPISATAANYLAMFCGPLDNKGGPSRHRKKRARPSHPRTV